MKYEENPFENETVAQEWIRSIENERGMIRERELLPLLRQWVERCKPRTIVDIGMGQGGCADTVQIDPKMQYIGVEPSEPLIRRAKEKNARPNREFKQGNAYALPLADACADAAFSINVWFHLKDLNTASKELARVLKPGGSFYICTANPAVYPDWRARFEADAHEDEEKIEGKVYVPINPLSRNIIYKHSKESILGNLEKHGLIVDETILNGVFDRRNGSIEPLFINIMGHKK